MRSLHINLKKQTLFTLENDRIVKEYVISSGLNGVGQNSGSGKTPRGHHYIRAKIGHGENCNAVFVARRPTGEIYSEALAQQYPQRDWILSRILWLCGLELGINRLGSVDSMSRYIYIHGTPDTEPMGVAKSHGCIRMRNRDVIELFEWVPEACPVLIEAQK